MGHGVIIDQDPKTEPQTGEPSAALTHALGRRIRVLRAEHGWSQETLSALTGLHRTYLSQVERGALHISVVQLAKIARAFAVPVGALVDGRETHRDLVSRRRTL